MKVNTKMQKIKEHKNKKRKKEKKKLCTSNKFNLNKIIKIKHTHTKKNSALP